MADNLTYIQLLDVLTDLVDQKSSGTMFVHSDTNHMVTFALDKGRICAIYYGPNRGRKAIAAISTIKNGSYRFEASNSSSQAQDIPPTPKILSQLKARELVGADEIPAAANVDPSSVSQEDKNKVCQELKDLLLEHLGPIAGMIFDVAMSEAGDFCSTPEGTRDFISKLSEDIDDADEAAAFKENANAVLRRFFS